MEKHGGMISTGEYSLFVQHSFLANSISSHLVAKQEEIPLEIMSFVLRNTSFHASKCYLTYRKIVRRGADGYTSPSKEGVLRTFIALGRF
jgi:hypothetical protein